MKTMLIKAEQVTEGYALMDADCNYVQEGRVHATRESAYADAAKMWPSDSVWRGRRVHGGYRIVID